METPDAPFTFGKLEPHDPKKSHNNLMGMRSEEINKFFVHSCKTKPNAKGGDSELVSYYI